jgi:hypothetical protein
MAWPISSPFVGGLPAKPGRNERELPRSLVPAGTDHGEERNK